MKQIIIFMFLCITTFSFCYAQNDSKNKEKFPSYDEFINISKPQIQEKDENCTLIDNESAFYLKSIIPELSIIRQQYRLERNGDFYGKNNKPYYGESFSLAIKVSGGTVFLSDVVEPWKRDADYARDNASGNYKPSLFWTYQRPINEANYKSVNLEIRGASDYVKPLNADKSLYLHTDAINDFGLSIDYTPDNKKGYMIWAYSKTDVQDSAMVIELRQSSLAVDAKADSSLTKMSPSDPEKLIGGIFVTPKYERGGRVQFLLSGVAVRSSSSGWDLQLLCFDDKNTKSEITSIITKTDEEKKGDSKKKKK